MCPYWDSSKKWCKVSPADSYSQYTRTESEQKSFGCTHSSNYKSQCPNYSKAQKGEYKIYR